MAHDASAAAAMISFIDDRLTWGDNRKLEPKGKCTMQEKQNGQPEFRKEQVSDDTCRRCGSSETRISACGDASDGVRRRELLCDECGEHWYEGQLPGCPNYQFLDDENEEIRSSSERGTS